MSIAVCIYCGEVKPKSLNSCCQCGRIPESAQDRAKSLVLSDRHLNQKGIEVIGAMVKRGEDPFRIERVRENYESILPKVIGMNGEQESGLLQDVFQDDVSVGMPRKTGVAPQQDRMPCPHCGELILCGAAKCRYCYEWVGQPFSETPTSFEPDPQTNTCPSCGRTFPPEDKTCPFCNNTILSLHARHTSSRTSIVSKAAIALVLIAGLTFGHFIRESRRVDDEARQLESQRREYDALYHKLATTIGYSSSGGDVGSNESYADLFTDDERRRIIKEFLDAAGDDRIAEAKRIVNKYTDREALEGLRRFQESIQYSREQIAALNEDREFNELVKRLKENYTADYDYGNLPRF